MASIARPRNQARCVLLHGEMYTLKCMYTRLPFLIGENKKKPIPIKVEVLSES